MMMDHRTLVENNTGCRSAKRGFAERLMNLQGSAAPGATYGYTSPPRLAPCNGSNVTLVSKRISSA